MKLVILVTGAAGFLGRHLSQHFLSKGFTVVGVDNFITGSRRNIEALANHQNFRFIERDVVTGFLDSDLAVDEKLLYVFHFASPASPQKYLDKPLETLRVNSEGLLQALQFAERHQARLIYASSSEIYGEPDSTPQSEESRGRVCTTGPRSCYTEAKRFGEALLTHFNSQHSGRHGLVRIFNSYGPYMDLDDGRVIIDMLMRAITHQELKVFGDGQQTRSFCYVDDTVAGIVAYAESQCSKPLNIGNAEEMTILELVESIQKLFPERKLKKVFMPMPIDDPKRRCPDLSQSLVALRPWQPQEKFEEGLQKTLLWLQQSL